MSPRGLLSRVLLMVSASFSGCGLLFSFCFRFHLAVRKTYFITSSLGEVTGVVTSRLSLGGSSGLLLKNFTYLLL